MNWEVERHQWSALRVDYGYAEGVPEAILRLESADTEEAARAEYWRIDNTVVVQGAVYEAALATVPCLLAILLRASRVARPHILELLVQIGGGEPAKTELESGEPNIVEMCLREIAHGVPVFADFLE